MVAISFCLPLIADCTAITHYSQWMASSIISRQQGILSGRGGSSELLQAGIVQKAFARLVEQYPDESSSKVFGDYVVKSVGSVTSFLSNATKDVGYPLDRFSNGNGLIELSKATGNESYATASKALRTSLDLQKRNEAGGLWYYVYPNWSYLDGMFSYAPFYSLYASTFEPANKTVVAKEILYQMTLLWEHCRNESSGLLVHGYDYSKTAVWANSVTGASPHVWGRSLGWYAIAVVDTLEFLPIDKTSAEWTDLCCKTVSLLTSITEAVDPASGAWWQILDEPGAPGNYIESSGSAMFVYALLRARQLGYLDAKQCGGNPALPQIARLLALRAYDYIVQTFVVNNNNGTLSYNGTVSVCSLNSTASYDVSFIGLNCFNFADAY
jgi:rhamnogalacturonyl hydrolase YesR